MNLAELPLGAVAKVTHVGGAGSFRRRLMELGLLPGTRVEVISCAPLGDPLELLVRGSSLSIRREQAQSVEIMRAPQEDSARDAERETWLSKLRRWSLSK
ncbi:MAG: FeoA family protein [Polyangiaceae bacterium]